MADNVVLQFTVLFTAQKAKKFKTWQDGTMKYYGSNKKLVLIDDKGYNIDRKFYKGNIPSVGDEIEFDGHIVTIEACDDPVNSPSTTPVAAAPQPVSTPFKKPSLKSILMARRNIPNTATTSSGSGYTLSATEADQATTASVSSATTTIPSSDSPIKPFTSPLKRKQRLVNVDPEELEDAMDIDESPVSTVEAAFGQPSTSTSNENTTVNNLQQQPKRARFGLSRPSSSTVNNIIKKSNTSTDQFIGSFTKASNIPETTESPTEPSNSTVNKPFKTPFVEGVYTTATLQFPSSRKALAVLKSRKYPKRSKIVPTKFPNVNVYRDTFKKIIYEHLEILLLNYGLYFYSIYEKYANGKQGNELERTIRAKGLGMYVDCEIKGDTRYQDSTRFRLVLRNKEHHSKYSKDDIWIISKVSTFDPSQTFLARSIFYGPFSDGTLEVDCVSPRDARIANKIVSEARYIYALRSISASTEFMMLDTLEEKLDSLPLLPYILGDRQGRKKKDLLPPAPLPTLAQIELRRDDCIDVNARLAETVARYRLNADQENVLRQVAASVITCPGWNEESQHPVVLVHGVYGSGKSFLAAVIILFIQELLDTVNGHREPEDQVQFKILVSSMTNIAVDRILQTLLKLGYDHFVRIGSMKKIAKNILPYTAKARLSSNEELKELEQMLDDGQNSEEDLENIATAIQRFRKSEGISQIHTAPVVGTTFMSSVFDIFNGVSFPFILIDESSQLMEPLTMVPLTRFSCHRLLMVGDPLQLPPTLVSPAEEGKIGKGLDKTLFDRFIEMGYESIMLRTQYRCHPKISAISNKLFYDRRLLNGVTPQDREPLLEGLPTVLFVDIGGTEQKSARTNSFWNDTEVSVTAKILQSMIELNVLPSEIGVVSLYKEQADKLSDHLAAHNSGNSTYKNIQISTVDAFQGGEKEIIVLSTVRTTESAFMQNEPRINVALTRAKRHLIILGDRHMLLMNDLWSKIIWDCEDQVMTHQSFLNLLQNLEIKT